MGFITRLRFLLIAFLILETLSKIKSQMIEILRRKAIWILPFTLISFAAPVEARNTEPYLCREIGQDWVWFEDHAALYVRYGIAGPDGRVYQIGTGLSVSGSPLGRRTVKSGRSEVVAIGVGALHIRRRDDGPDFIVCASGLGLGHIPVIPATRF